MFTYLRLSTNHASRLIWRAPKGFGRSVGITPHFDFTYPVKDRVTCLLGGLETALQAEGFGSPCTCFTFLTTQASARFIGPGMVSNMIQRRQRTEPQFCLGAETGEGKTSLAGGWVNGLSDLPRM